MLKKLVIILMLLLLLGTSYAQEDITFYKALTIESTITSPVDLEFTGGPVSIDYIHVNFSWIPEENHRQSLLSLSTEPSSIDNGESLFFDINTKDDFDFEVSYRTRTSSDPVEIYEKIPFPIKRLSPEFVKYTNPSELIDINDDIRKQAASIAAGENDLYVVVFKIADWVNSEIDYNLSTVTSEASLPSSWVLENKRGVCDELSNLYVSMLRSLGIPARIVSGISYTNSPLFDYNWGAHGWTEVYFPDYGWVSFDPTYNQLGYVDATHIKMKDKDEDERFNTQYTWLGKGFEIVPGNQEIRSDIISTDSRIRKNVALEINYFRDIVDLGSYNVISATIKNKEQYYVSRVLDISRVEGITILDEKRKDILLKPGDSKTVSWIVKVDEFLDEDFIYTFPFSVYTGFDNELSRGFQALEGEESVSLAVANSVAAEENGFYSQSRMTCRIIDEDIYIDKPALVKCRFSRTGLPPQVKVCVKSQCIDKDVQIDEFDLELIIEKPGFQTLLLTAETENWKDEAFISLNVVDSPHLIIRNLTVDDKIKFDETGLISFIVERDGGGTARNVRVNLEHDLFKNEWTFDTIRSLQGFSINVEGSSLKSKDNNFKILVEYYDDKGQRYFTTKQVEIELYDLTFWQRILLFFNNLEVIFQ